MNAWKTISQGKQCPEAQGTKLQCKCKIGLLECLWDLHYGQQTHCVYRVSKKKTRYSSSQHASPCAIRNHTVLPATRQRWYSHLYPQPVKAGTQFSNLGKMQVWVDLVRWLHTEVAYPTTITDPSTNRAQCRVTSYMQRMLWLHQTTNCVWSMSQ